MDEILTGWKEIAQITGRSANTLRRLVRDEGMPVATIGGKPTTTRRLLEEWFISRIRQAHTCSKSGYLGALGFTRAQKPKTAKKRGYTASEGEDA